MNNHRLITLEGGFNFRDIGGYAIMGGETRRGLIYRSGTLSQLTDNDRACLQQLGIRTSFDLRDPQEYIREGHDNPGDGVNVVLVPTSLGVAAIREQLTRDAKAFRMVDFYCSSLGERVDYHADLFRQILAAMQNPLVIHCSAGKDRTGIIIALLLRLAGVADADIISDYADTEIHLKAYAELRRMEFAKMGMPDFAIEEMLSAPAERMAAMLVYLDEAFGSAEDYLIQGGITPAEIDHFREQFVISL